MTISIWIIFVLIATIAIWFYYKKNKTKIKKPVSNNSKNKTKQNFSDIDKMLSHVTEKEKVKADEDKENTKEPVNDKVIKETKKEENKNFDITKGVISSIILKKKD